MEIKKLVILMIVWLLLPSMVYAKVAFDSYSDVARTIQSDTFSEYGKAVCMKATGLPKDENYEIRYYDGAMTLIQAEVNMAVSGELLSMILPSNFKSAVAGTWTAELYDLTPVKLISTDTFSVAGSAIPEFPTPLVGIFVVGICFGIYYWMRRKR